MAEGEKVFQCPDGETCNLTEEIINQYDPKEYMDILDLLQDHGIEADDAETFVQAQTLLFEHLKLREKKYGNKHGSVKIDIVQEAVKEHHVRRRHLLGVAKKVGEFLKMLPPNRKKELKRYFPSLDTDLDRAISELAEEKSSFIVAGETGSGKSCFINLLMGHTKQNFLPVSNCPSTSCLCEISYGDVAKVRAYKSGSVIADKEALLDEENMTKMLSEFTHQKENRDKGIMYTRVEVEWPLDWLKDGITIIDSPGVGERREITEMVKERMPGAYGFIYVINTTKAGGIQEGELEDLLFKQSTTRSNASGADMQEKRLSDEFDPRTAIFVFNKWDLVENKEKQKIKEFVEGKLKKIFHNIDPESQMFFISTQQATKTLEEKQWMTEDYKKVLQGVEKLMVSSMKSKMTKYQNFFAELLSRLAFILKAYISNFGDFQRKYKEVREKLEKLKTMSKKVREGMMEMLKVEGQEIIIRLQSHMQDPKTKERLGQWHPSECPTHATNWQVLYREAGVRSHERVINEIKQWESDTNIFQKANTKLMNAFQAEFVSLKQNLGDIESDILGPETGVADKDVRRLLGDISHSITDTDDTIFSTKEKHLISARRQTLRRNIKDDYQNSLSMDIAKVVAPQTAVAIGVTAPLWVPIAILAAPFVIGWAVREVMRESREEREYYEGYLDGSSGSLSELMAKETSEKVKSVMQGEGLKNLIKERMQELVKKMLALMNKIPEFVRADQELLHDMRHDYEEGINQETKNQCINLARKVARLQNKLDYFQLQYIHEDAVSEENLEPSEELLGEGAFGQVFKYRMTDADGKKIFVAAKIMKNELTEENATELRMEHSNLMRIECENTIKYYGLVLFVERCGTKLQTTPIMLMEICNGGALNEMIYNTTLYVGPGTLDPSKRGRSDLLLKMRNFAMQLANGLKHMHKCSLVHRDLKPANVLVERKTGQDRTTRYVLKICDFGLTKDTELILNTMCGTPLYMAPEVADNKMYDQKSDIYSYGLILIELFYGKLVANLKFVEVRLRPTTFSADPLALNSPPESMKSFMSLCWETKPEKRPTAKECYEHFKDDRQLEISV